MIKKFLKFFYRKYKIIVEKILYKKNFYAAKNFFKKLIGNDKLVFDIGANIGEKTKIFYQLGNRVVTVEPQGEIYGQLKEKFKNNNQITIVHKGVGRHIGELNLNISSKYLGFSSFLPDWQKGTKYDSFDRIEKVEITTLDNLIKEFGLPYFCKIDVEGYELEVLNGLTAKIPYLNIEYHGDNFELTTKCLDRLDYLGFKLFNYTEGEQDFALKNWVSRNNLTNELTQKIKINNQIWGDIYAK